MRHMDTGGLLFARGKTACDGNRLVRLIQGRARDAGREFYGDPDKAAAVLSLSLVRTLITPFAECIRPGAQLECRDHKRPGTSTMRWRGRRRSSNIEDRRGQRQTRLTGRPLQGGIGLVVMLLAAAYFGIDPSVVLNQGLQQRAPSQSRPAQPRSAAEDELAAFISVVLADTEDTWHSLFKAEGGRYQEPRLVLFTDAVRSACGHAEAAMGPFYCPGDNKVYIDLSFYRDLRERHGAPGDFAQAYVVAHEVGHHVQTLMGISKQVHAARSRASKTEGNKLSVKQELQADCFAGLWAHHANRSKQILESGDIEEAMTAATAIGDDRLQQQGRGYITPESFTHGTSAQRVRWFKTGLERGEIAACDTFAAARL